MGIARTGNGADLAPKSKRAPRYDTLEEKNMLGTILLIILVLLLLGAAPAWPHSRSWGYGPSGVLGLVLAIVLILVLMGRI
jgi:hypothetical protein